MNAFYEHHKHNTLFQYSCFDRILLNGVLIPFQNVERILGFFESRRHIRPLTKQVLTTIADQTHNCMKHRSQQWSAPILDAPRGRRDEFVTPFFHHAKPDQIVVILRAREPAHILTAIGSKQTNRYHFEFQLRWVNVYNVYINDEQWGRMFVRVCPYLPFSVRICLNQHNWLAIKLRQRGIRFKQSTNAFLACSDPEALQQLADSLQPDDLLACARKWLAALIPFFTEQERREGWDKHRFFFSQAEYCNTIIFKRRAPLDRLAERLLDSNRTIGHPEKITTIFGRKLTKRYRGELKTVIADMGLANPVIRSFYKNSSIKQYVRDGRGIRTEASTNNVRDLGVNKAVANLAVLRTKCNKVVDTYLDVQQDIAETFIDRGQFSQLSQPTVTESGKRVPGLRIDHPRTLALMQSLVRFSHIAGGCAFTTRELLPETASSLGQSSSEYTLGSLRYDLSKLRAKGLVEKLPRQSRYRLSPEGYRLSVVFLKLFHKVYAPLTAGIMEPVNEDSKLPAKRMTALDKLYLGVAKALDRVAERVGLKVAA